MTDNNSYEDISRRRYLLTGGAAGAAMVGLAGCTGNSNNQTTTKSGTTTSKQSSGETTTSGNGGGGQSYNTLEIQHWWTGGDGADAIKALMAGFEKKYPDIKVKQNPVAGGAGQNLHTVIKKRILNDNPPSSWQAWPGKNLTPFTNANKLADIESDVWDKNGMKDAYLEGPKQAAKPAGNYVTVPLNIHRLNNLFYNVPVVKKAGVDPSSIKKPSDLLDAMKQVENKTDAVGMAQQTKSGWSTLQLWVEVLIGEHGLDTYKKFYSGNTSAVESQMKDAFDIVKQYKQYFNEDAGSIDWTQANTKIIDGKAAFFHQGDWAAGMYRSQSNFEFKKDWNQVPYPGTTGLYVINMDSFPFPKNNPSPEATKKFLQFCGSVEGQKLFNPKKGSIPPRTDVPKDAFDAFSQRQMDQFKNSKAQPMSTTHGLTTPPDVLTSLKDATATFVSNWDANQAYKQFSQSFS